MEGYVESAAMGLMAGRMAAAEALGLAFDAPPPTTAHGALINHITGGHIETTDGQKSSFQPMNINFGLLPPIDKVKVKDGVRLKHTEQAVERKHAYTGRAKADFVHELVRWSGLDQLPPGSRVLDVGCGYHPFKGRINNIVGIDPYNNCADYEVDILDYKVKPKSQTPETG